MVGEDGSIALRAKLQEAHARQKLTADVLVSETLALRIV